MTKKIEQAVLDRSSSSCEICGNAQNVSVKHIEKMDDDQPTSYVVLCSNCAPALSEGFPIEGNAWRNLSEVMWSEIDGVKVLSWRLLNRSEESWAREALEMLYIEDELLEVAKALQPETSHYDSNGNPLYKGDSVVLIKDLDVKGSSLVAKRGTAVRNISLVHDDPSHIMGKVEGQTIYIKTEFVKK